MLDLEPSLLAVQGSVLRELGGDARDDGAVVLVGHGSSFVERGGLETFPSRVSLYYPGTGGFIEYAQSKTVLDNPVIFLVLVAQVIRVVCPIYMLYADNQRFS